MNLDEVIMELYRLAETREWQDAKSDEALLVAIEGMEQIWSLRLADKRRSAKTNLFKKQTRVWS
jgi:hypothetical protein